LIVVTDYTEYTHLKSIKNALIEEIRCILINTNGLLEPYILSDIALRVLLKISKKYASKFKFAVDDYMNLSCNMLDTVTDDPLSISGLKELYDKHKIFGIKICMSPNEEKYIAVDGKKGKLISRSKSMEISDIDELVKLISEIVKYDYLNSDYIKQTKDIAKRVLVGPTTNKIAQVESMYSVINTLISQTLKDKTDKDGITLVFNAFFYSLLKKVKIVDNIELTYVIDDGVALVINKIFGMSVNKINKLFNMVINLALIQESDMLLAELDDFIKRQGEEHASSI